jgi:hypothetical protein
MLYRIDHLSVSPLVYHEHMAKKRKSTDMNVTAFEILQATSEPRQTASVKKALKAKNPAAHSSASARRLPFTLLQPLESEIIEVGHCIRFGPKTD